METERKIKAELAKIQELGLMMKGTVNKVGTKPAGKKQAKTIYQLTFKGKGNVTKTLYVRREMLTDAKKMISNYGKVKKILGRVLCMNYELFRRKSADIRK